MKKSEGRRVPVFDDRFASIEDFKQEKKERREKEREKERGWKRGETGRQMRIKEKGSKRKQKKRIS
jgi:hypothetical protein